MAVLKKTQTPYIEDGNSNQFIGLKMPLSIGNTEGWGASTTTTIEAISENMRNLLQTEQGERVNQPFLGANLRQFCFEPITDSLQIVIKDHIKEVLNIWMPFVEVKEIVVRNQDINADNNTYSIKILFALKQDPTTLESIQVNIIGG
tara:strand:- start:1637 stop:2077 length:441 start_codon:yes stop_codon:yes gene_type:complete